MFLMPEKSPEIVATTGKKLETYMETERQHLLFMHWNTRSVMEID